MSDARLNLLPGRLRAMRKRRGFSQVGLASLTGLPASSISHFESGARAPNLENLMKLADALDVSVDAILGREAAQAPSRIQNTIDGLSDYQLQLVEGFIEMLGKTARRGR